jgi:hypothetical protein
MPSNRVKKDTSSKSEIVKLVVLICGVIILWAISGYLIYVLIPNWSDRGTVGDMFGAGNALFSGLAFAALIYTIYLQREDIKLNRSEISMNRKELKKAAIAQQNQVQQTQLTTKINAISTVINYYNIQIANPNISTDIVEKAKAKRKALIGQIDSLIDGLNDSDLDD